MNIAVCLSGAPRNVSNSIESIELISRTGKVKIFAHTWNAVSGSSLESVSTNLDSWLEHESCSAPDLIKRFSFEKIQLDCFETHLELIKQFTKKHGLVLHGYKHGGLSCFCKLYSMRQVELLKSRYETENAMVFDMVYSLRFDSFIQTPENLMKDIFPVETLAIPDERNETGGINDQFAYGTSAAMSTYLSSFERLSELAPTLGHISGGEVLMKRIIDHLNISPLRTNLRVTSYRGRVHD
jgi:hypothetical protein